MDCNRTHIVYNNLIIKKWHKVLAEFGLSLFAIILIYIIWFFAQHKKIVVALLFWLLIIFTVTISNTSVKLLGKFQSNFTLIPLYIWIVWSLLIHYVYDATVLEENYIDVSIPSFVKSVTLLFLLVITNIWIVFSSITYNKVLFVVMSLVWVIPAGYLCFVDVFSLYDTLIILLKTILFLIMYIIYDEYINSYETPLQEVKTCICVNNTLWILAVDVIFLPVYFIQIVWVATVIMQKSRRRVVFVQQKDGTVKKRIAKGPSSAAPKKKSPPSSLLGGYSEPKFDAHPDKLQRLKDSFAMV
jgi:hypothetical protein